MFFGTRPDRYMIPRYTDIEQFFNINSEDGMIVTTRPLDRETQPWHNISVSATEIGGRTHTRAHTRTSLIGTPCEAVSGVFLVSFCLICAAETINDEAAGKKKPPDRSDWFQPVYIFFFPPCGFGQTEPQDAAVSSR